MAPNTGIGGLTVGNQTQANILAETSKYSVPSVSSLSTIATVGTNGLSATNRVLQSSALFNQKSKSISNEKTKKSEVLRIEALLDKNLPSIEANTQVLQNYVNSGRIRQLIDQLVINPMINVSTIMETIDRMSKKMSKQSNHSIDSLEMFSLKTIRSNSETNNYSQTFLSLNNNISYDLKSGDILSEQLFHQSIGLTNESNHVFEGNQRLDTSLMFTTYESKPICGSVPPKLSKSFIFQLKKLLY